MNGGMTSTQPIRIPTWTGEHLRDLRERYGFETQPVFAQRIGIEAWKLSDLETDSTIYVKRSVELLWRIKVRLNCSWEMLLDLHGSAIWGSSRVQELRVAFGFNSRQAFALEVGLGVHELENLETERTEYLQRAVWLLRQVKSVTGCSWGELMMGGG